ncbi:MAG TPA: circadian clock KaiB family protein [Bacteroidales bacterium]|nr:circadian clock KaiB family protein [Bacteroidales bacterium]
MKEKRKPVAKARVAAERKSTNEKYLLKLYVTGSTSNSVKAISNIKEICDNYLEGRYDLQIIDLYKDPALASGEQIIAAPTLIRKLPLPLRRIIGDLSATEKVLAGLEIKPKE